jgi:hypothetical protein
MGMKGIIIARQACQAVTERVNVDDIGNRRSTDG